MPWQSLSLLLRCRWLSVRLESLGSCLVFCSAITSAVILHTRHAFASSIAQRCAGECCSAALCCTATCCSAPAHCMIERGGTSNASSEAGCAADAAHILQCRHGWARGDRYSRTDKHPEPAHAPAVRQACPAARSTLCNARAPSCVCRCSRPLHLPGCCLHAGASAATVGSMADTVQHLQMWRCR